MKWRCGGMKRVSYSFMSVRSSRKTWRAHEKCILHSHHSSWRCWVGDMPVWLNRPQYFFFFLFFLSYFTSHSILSGWCPVQILFFHSSTTVNVCPCLEDQRKQINSCFRRTTFFSSYSSFSGIKKSISLHSILIFRVL